jgi:hypothetical protein
MECWSDGQLQRDVTATLWEAVEGFCFAKKENRGLLVIE